MGRGGRRRAAYGARDFRRDLFKGLLVLLAGVALAAGLVAWWWSAASTPAGWRRTVGTVISVEITAKGAKRVEVDYSVGDEPFRLDLFCPWWSREVPTTPQDGDRLPVIYDPGDPADARVAGWGAAGAEFYGWPALVMVGFGVLRIFFALHDRLRSRTGGTARRVAAATGPARRRSGQYRRGR